MIRLRPDDWASAQLQLLRGEQALAAFVAQAQSDGFDPDDESVQALKLKD